jgi:Uma2 family endonuclease
MTTMNPSLTSEIVQASEHLPEGASLAVPGVAWEDYEHLLNELAGRRRLRVSFDRGRLEIVSPLSEHENYGDLIRYLVRAYADVKDLDMESFGTATWRREAVAKGAEADACFYVRNASRIIGKKQIDLDKDPPPDIVVEIETTTSARHKFVIYAALLVPEIWTYDGKRVHFYELTDEAYAPISESRFLPGLTRTLLAEHIEICKTQGQTKALRIFRQRIS